MDTIETLKQSKADKIRQGRDGYELSQQQQRIMQQTMFHMSSMSLTRDFCY